MSRQTKRPAAQDPAGAAPEASSGKLDVYDQEKWGPEVFMSRMARKLAEWRERTEKEGYSQFKTPKDLGYKSDFDAGKRYAPTLNKNGEWVQNDQRPLHRASDIPSEKRVSQPRASVTAKDRAASNKGLREQAPQNGESAPKRLPQPMERRERLVKKRAADATIRSEPTRKSARIRDNSVPANASAPTRTPAVSAANAAESKASALVPTSENTVTASRTSAMPTAMAPMGATVSTEPVTISSVALAVSVSMQTNNDIVPDHQPEDSVAPVSMQTSNDNVQPEKPVAPVAVLQGSRSSVSQAKATSQALCVTWKMDAALARNMQSILSTISSIKQEEDDGKSNKAIAGKKRKAADDDKSRPSKKVATGKVANNKKRKAEGQSSPSKKRKTEDDDNSSPPKKAITGRVVNDKKRKAEGQSGPSKKRTRISHACKGCQHWRVKCDGASPCSMCVKRGMTCVYDKNEDAQDDDPLKEEASEPKGDKKPSRSQAAAPSTKRAPATRTAATKASKKSGASRADRGPSCNMCREKKTGCNREKPCSNCEERGWNCVYGVPQTAEQPKKPSGGGGSGSDAPGKKPSGGEQKNSSAEATSSHQPDGPSNGSSAQQANDAADDTNNLSGRASENEIRSILPAISKWIIKCDYGFQDIVFNFQACFTKRKLEKRVDKPEEEPQDVGILETATNEQRTQEESFHSRPSIKLVLPDHLKGFLVDDWENVTKNGLVVELPHSKATVDQILKDYVEYEKQHRQEGSAHMDILVETTEGLREYFDKALARILLYRFERLQWAEISKDWTPEQSPCTTYGAEHLCRLLVSLPELVAQTNMDAQSVSRLREELTKFTNWLEKRTGQYFVSEYINPGPDYADKARG